MIVNRGRNFFGLALGAGVESADDALQFGEFLDEFGGEIGFRKPRCAHRVELGAIRPKA